LEEIRRSEERFRSIFNSTLVGIAITDPDGRWLYFNNALLSMLGYSAEELKQVKWTDITPPEDLAHEMEIFRTVRPARTRAILRSGISEKTVHSLMSSSQPV
jgi:PAS domain S-box-containing protein